jgi:signal transduction histidine kinase
VHKLIPGYPLSIRAQMSLLVIAVTLPAAAGMVWFILAESRDATQAAYSRVKDLARETKSHLDTILTDYDDLFDHLVARPGLKRLDSKRCDPILAEYQRLHPEFNSLLVRDARANPICSTHSNDAPGANAFASAWFQRGIGAKEFTVGDAEQDDYTGRKVSVLTHHIVDDAGKVSGLVSLPLDLLKLNRRVLSATPSGAVVTVVDRAENILLRSIEPEKWIGQRAPAANSDDFSSQGDSLTLRKGIDGVSRLYASISMPSTGWQIIAGMPEEEVFASHRERLKGSAALGLAAMALWVWLAYRISAAIVKPMRELAGTAQRVTAGDTAARASIGGPRELEAVAGEFNRMLDARVRAEDSAREANEQLRQLAIRLNNLHETESGLLSRELHDEFGQMLARLKMDLVWIASRLDAGSVELQNKVASTLALVDSSVQSVHSIAARLRPRILDDLGLLPAVEWLVQDFRERYGINAALVSNTQARTLKPEQATAVFRIVQEALINIARHADAKRIDVSLYAQDGWLTLEVRDNGRGVSEDEKISHESIGLLGMRERASAAGGELTLRGVAGRGTVVTLRLPLAEDKA